MKIYVVFSFITLIEINSIKALEVEPKPEHITPDCTYTFDPFGKQGPCYPRTSNRFYKPSLRERLQVLVPHKFYQKQDPRFPFHVELHSRHLIPKYAKTFPKADPDWLHLHYKSRGDVLPSSKRLSERPGPLYTFEGTKIPCTPQYSFQNYLEPPMKFPNFPKEPGIPAKPELDHSRLCIRTR